MKVFDNPTISKTGSCVDASEAPVSGEKSNLLRKCGALQIRIVSGEEAAAISKKTAQQLKAVRKSWKRGTVISTESSCKTYL